MISDKTVQLVLQGIVALALLALAGWQIYSGQAVDDWIVVAITAVLGVLFGASAVNGQINNKRGR